MRYCQETTQSHPLSKHVDCLKQIKQIIEENIEPKNIFRINNNFVFQEEIAFDLDKIKDCSNDNDIKGYRTVDMFCGMKDIENNKTILLVEFKLNCNGTKSLPDQCKGKIEDSKILLFGGGFPIHSNVFVFNDKLLSELRDEIVLIIRRRLNHPNAEVLSIQELKANYF